jgi:phospholipid transport system substrate-binding protein
MYKKFISGVETMGRYLWQKNAFQALLLVSLLLIVFDSGTIAVAETEPKVQLQTSVDEILKILQSEELKGAEKKEERHQRILSVVEDMFDFREMARSSLGQSWNTLTPEEQDKFVKLFTGLVEQRYIGKIDSYDNQKVVYKKALVRDDRAMIYTAVVDKDLEVPIVYRMERTGDKWLVYDVKIENVSLIVNYRRDFDSIIRKEQFAGLVEKITKQLEKPETSN